jgi:hypothetical protein
VTALLRSMVRALAAFGRGFTGLHAHAADCPNAEAARRRLTESAARRDRCC